MPSTTEVFADKRLPPAACKNQFFSSIVEFKVIRDGSKGRSARGEWPWRGIAEAVAMETGTHIPVSLVDVHQLASVIRNRIENVLIIDSRSFIEHNTCHITTAVNVCCSKIVKRRLQQDKLSVKEFLMHTCHCDVDDKSDVVVYDPSSIDAESLLVDSFILILLKKLQLSFCNVSLLAGGFNVFHENYPELCEDKTRKCVPLTSLSQPCLPVTNQGPTRILPFLYLGSQFDALNKELLKDHNITYELNVSTTCPQPEFVQEGHFMRIPVNDNYSEKLLPYFPEAFNFLDKVREGSGCVLVHCLAGISRSPTVAIAYVMRYLRLSSDDGYRYVKSKRPTISPNFNFLGQLLEYEKQLRKENILDGKPEVTSAPPLCSKKRLCRTDMRTTKLSLDINTKVKDSGNIFLQAKSGDQSPTTALAKLSFGAQQTPDEKEEASCQPWFDFRQYRSKSCYGDWLSDREDSMVEQKSRECNAATASKVLSPVKEIKCDALISEISVGQCGTSLKSTGTVRQKIASYQRHDGEKHSKFSPGRHSICVPNFEERFSFRTLSQTSSTSSQNFSSSLSKQQHQTMKGKTSQIQFSGPQDTTDTADNKCFLSEAGIKRVCHVSLDRSLDQSFKSKKMESRFVFEENSAPQYKGISLLHPSSSESYRRSDSAGTSGFGSESSDYADYAGDCYQSGNKIGIEEFEDDVIVRNNENSKRFTDQTTKDGEYFSLSLPEVTTSVWNQELESPLSPSESHLLEDLAMDKEIYTGIDSRSRSGSEQHLEYPDESFHDSGVSMLPLWLWPRKRVAASDSQPICDDLASKRDKRRCEPLAENFPKHQELWFLNIHRKQKENSINLSPDAYQRNSKKSDKIGLYRVQSCPGILSELSVSSTWESHPNEPFPGNVFNFQGPGTGFKSNVLCSTFSLREKGFTKDPLCHESCPDVLHLSETDNVHGVMLNRQRDFRRKVRMIQVS